MSITCTSVEGDEIVRISLSISKNHISRFAMLLTAESNRMSGFLGSFGGGTIMVLSLAVNSPVRTLQ